MPLNVVALSASTTGANSRRGSNCSSIYRNNTSQNTYRPVPLVHRNSKGVDQSVTRSTSLTTSFNVTDTTTHPNSRNNQQTTTNNNEKQRDELQPNSATNNHTSTTSPAVEDTNTDPKTVCMPVICR
jgi:hypothetical protein